MKIALYGAHQGLLNMMYGLLGHHEIVYYDNNVYTENEPKIFEEEVAISTFPYRELGILPENKKVIVYATDPFLHPEHLKENMIIVGDGDGIGVYFKELYPIIPQFVIPHSIVAERMPKYTGEIPMVAICNRKAEERWGEICSEPLDSFLKDIPHEIIKIERDKDFFDYLAKFRIALYFSNNPYTLMMFEMMQMGIPIVAYGNCRYSPEIMKKYLNRVSVTRQEIRDWLLDGLKEPKQEVYLNKTESYDAMKKWDEVINYANKS